MNMRRGYGVNRTPSTAAAINRQDAKNAKKNSSLGALGVLAVKWFFRKPTSTCLPSDLIPA
jgi:hypothetical protein